MPSHWKGGRSRSTRCGAAFASLIAACALAFVVTAGTVYLLGTRLSHRPQVHLARTAVHLEHDADSAAGPLAPAEFDVASVRRALAAHGTVPPDLQIAVETGTVPGRTTVELTLRSEAGEEAAAMLGRLARRLADERRSEWETGVRQAQLRAKQAADNARTRWLAAEAQRRDFLAEHFGRLEQQAKEFEASAEAWTAAAAPPVSEYRAPPPVAARVQSPSRPPLVEDPRWTELARAVEQLEERRRELLEQRTPAHPEVRGVEDQLAEARRQLSATPRFIEGLAPAPHRGAPGPLEGGAGRAAPDQADIPAIPPFLEPDGDEVEYFPAFRANAAQGPGEAAASDDRPAPGAVPAWGAPLPSVDLARVAEEDREAARDFAAIEARCAAARKEYDRLGAEEAAVLLKTAGPPRVELESAVAPEVQADERGLWEIALLALGAGLAAAASVALVSWSGGRSASFATVEELQAGLPVPVVGNLGRRPDGARR